MNMGKYPIFSINVDCMKKQMRPELPNISVTADISVPPTWGPKFFPRIPGIQDAIPPCIEKFKHTHTK